MTTPNEVVINNKVYTRIVNNLEIYIAQNNSNYPINVFASSTDLGATVNKDLYVGYLIDDAKTITNEHLKGYRYVYAMSLSEVGKVNV